MYVSIFMGLEVTPSPARSACVASYLRTPPLFFLSFFFGTEFRAWPVGMGTIDLQVANTVILEIGLTSTRCANLCWIHRQDMNADH
jgi:hypothetical protein